MARYNKLLKKDRDKLLIALCEAISTIKDSQEAAKLLTDLLSPAEIEIIAKRLEIAKLLTQGKTYSDIRNRIKAGFSTIARVNTWLNLAGEGFKIAISRAKKEPIQTSIDEKLDPYSWYNMGRRYPARIWPLLAIEEFMKIANNRERSKLVHILESMKDKKNIFTKETNRELFEKFKNGNTN